MLPFQGLYTALITPFTKGGTSIDYDSFGRILERQVAAGVAGVVPCGTTGESPTLTHTEHAELIRRTVETISGRTQVIAGTGSNSTAEAVKLSKEAEQNGVDAVMLVNPYYNKPSQEGLYRHFAAVADSVGIPVVIYNIKGRTAVNLEVETLVRLAERPNIRCVKEASGDLAQMIRIHRELGERMTILSGDDIIVAPVMAIGGRGIISVASNLFPKRMVAMVADYLKGDFGAGNRAFYRLVDVLGALFSDTNPVPVKAAAASLGLCGPDLRLPLCPMEPGRVESLMKLIRELGAEA